MNEDLEKFRDECLTCEWFHREYKIAEKKWRVTCSHMNERKFENRTLFKEFMEKPASFLERTPRRCKMYTERLFTAWNAEADEQQNMEKNNGE